MTPKLAVSSHLVLIWFHSKKVLTTVLSFSLTKHKLMLCDPDTATLWIAADIPPSLDKWCSSMEENQFMPPLRDAL